MKVTDYIRTEETLKTLRNAEESSNDGPIIAMVLKGLPDTFSSFSIYMNHNNKDLTFSKFKTQFEVLKIPKKYRQNSSNDKIMKLINSFSKTTSKELT